MWYPEGHRRAGSESDLISDLSDGSDERTDVSYSDSKENYYYNRHHRDFGEVSPNELDFLRSTGSYIPGLGRTKRKCVIEGEKKKSYLLDTESPPLETYEPAPPKQPRASTGRRGRPPKLGPDGLPLRKNLRTSQPYIASKSDGFIYVFSSLLANISSKVVLEGRCKSIIDYHKSIHFPNNIITDEHVKGSVQTSTLFAPKVQPHVQPSYSQQHAFAHGIPGVNPNIPMMPTLPSYRMLYANQSQSGNVRANSNFFREQSPLKTYPQAFTEQPLTSASPQTEHSEKQSMASVDTFSPVSKTSDKLIVHPHAESSSWDDKNEESAFKLPVPDRPQVSTFEQNIEENRKGMLTFSKLPDFNGGTTAGHETAGDN